MQNILQWAKLDIFSLYNLNQPRCEHFCAELLKLKDKQHWSIVIHIRAWYKKINMAGCELFRIQKLSYKNHLIGHLFPTLYITLCVCLSSLRHQRSPMLRAHVWLTKRWVGIAKIDVSLLAYYNSYWRKVLSCLVLKTVKICLLYTRIIHASKVSILYKVVS